MTSGEMFDKLRQLRPVLMSRYRAKELGVFGSWVRGEQTEASDVRSVGRF